MDEKSLLKQWNHMRSQIIHALSRVLVPVTEYFSSDGQTLFQIDFGLVKLADERRQHVGILRVIIVARPIKVRRHCRNPIPPILFSIGLNQFDARNFRDGIPFIGWL